MSAFANFDTKSINSKGPVAFESSELFKSFETSLASNDVTIANEALEAVKSLCEECDQWVEPYVVEVLPFILESLANPKTKETAYATESTIIKALESSLTAPESKKIAGKAIEKADEEIKRYKAEKAEIMEEAAYLDADAAYCQERGGNFGFAIMFLQIAIMLSAIAALMKKQIFWFIGLCAGALGVGFLAYAWPLYEKFHPAPVAPVHAVEAKAAK